MTTTTRPQTEAQFQQAVIDYAKLMGWRVFHAFDSRRSEPGFPDLTMVRNGRLIFVELKRDIGRLTKSQARWGADLMDCEGVLWECWRPLNWPEIEETLR